MHSTARIDKKVSQQNNATDPNNAPSMITSARLTASLEAAITPTLPPARRNSTCGELTSAMIRLASAIAWLTVLPS
ncbi:hypothetical protein D3C76_543910 [compost metagenome]